MSGATFTIRRAQSGDLAEAAALFETVANSTMPWLPRATQDTAAFLAAAREEEVFIAEGAGRIVGLAAFYPPADFLHSLYVAADWQGRGVGRALLATVAAVARAPLSLKVQLRNEPARRFYAAAGFREADRGSDEGFDWVRLVRTI